MDEDRTSRASRSWKLICLLVVVSGLASFAVYLAHVPDFFMGDDFELIGDALAGKSPFQPVASHLRPVIRLHFLCFVRGRLAIAYTLLGAAALSYELWLVVPLLFLFHFRRARELILPCAMVGVYLGLQMLTFGAAGASAYGGFSLAELPLRFSIYAFRLLSPLAGSPGPGVSLLLSALLLSLFAVPRFRFPAALYAASALLFSFSAHVSSRFYYFPSLALILIIALGLDSPRRAVRLIGATLAVYLALASPWINYLDGEDYARKAEFHHELYTDLESRIQRMAEGQQGVVVNRLGPQRLASLKNTRLGRPKLIFIRKSALGGMIYPDDAVRMALWDRAERPLDADCSGRTIEVGQGELRSTYCFRVAPR